MKKRLQIQALLAVFAVGMIFSSCGDIDIVKRKYRPGFHVDITKDKKKNKVAQKSAVADSRKAKKLKKIEAKKPKIALDKIDDSLTASSGKATPDSKTIKKKNRDPKPEKVLQRLKNLDFKRLIRDLKDEIKPNKSPARVDTNWFKWLSFGSGVISVIFGFVAVVIAILAFALVANFLWPALIIAIVMGGAAITFFILYKKKGGADRLGKLGMIFGVIGIAMALLAVIIWGIIYALLVA